MPGAPFVRRCCIVARLQARRAWPALRVAARVSVALPRRPRRIQRRFVVIQLLTSFENLPKNISESEDDDDPASDFEAFLEEVNDIEVKALFAMLFVVRLQK